MSIRLVEFWMIFCRIFSLGVLLFLLLLLWWIFPCFFLVKLMFWIHEPSFPTKGQPVFVVGFLLSDQKRLMFWIDTPTLLESPKEKIRTYIFQCGSAVLPKTNEQYSNNWLPKWFSNILLSET